MTAACSSYSGTKNERDTGFANRTMSVTSSLTTTDGLYHPVTAFNLSNLDSRALPLYPQVPSSSAPSSDHRFDNRLSLVQKRTFEHQLSPHSVSVRRDTNHNASISSNSLEASRSDHSSDDSSSEEIVVDDVVEHMSTNQQGATMLGVQTELQSQISKMNKFAPPINDSNNFKNDPANSGPIINKNESANAESRSSKELDGETNSNLFATRRYEKCPTTFIRSTSDLPINDSQIAQSLTETYGNINRHLTPVVLNETANSDSQYYSNPAINWIGKSLRSHSNRFTSLSDFFPPMIVAPSSSSYLSMAPSISPLLSSTATTAISNISPTLITDRPTQPNNTDQLRNSIFASFLTHLTGPTIESHALLNLLMENSNRNNNNNESSPRLLDQKLPRQLQTTTTKHHQAIINNLQQSLETNNATLPGFKKTTTNNNGAIRSILNDVDKLSTAGGSNFSNEQSHRTSFGNAPLGPNCPTSTQVDDHGQNISSSCSRTNSSRGAMSMPSLSCDVDIEASSMQIDKHNVVETMTVNNNTTNNNSNNSYKCTQTLWRMFDPASALISAVSSPGSQPTMPPASISCSRIDHPIDSPSGTVTRSSTTSLSASLSASLSSAINFKDISSLITSTNPCNERMLDANRGDGSIHKSEWPDPRLKIIPDQQI